MSSPEFSDPTRQSGASGSGKLPWYEDIRVIGILLMLVGVLALPLVWFNKRFTVKKKIFITIISVVIATVLFWVSARILDVIANRTEDIQQTRESALGKTI